MPDGKMKIDMTAHVLPKITERMELAGYDDRDIMALRAVAFHSGVNGNGAIIERADAERAVYSLVGKPLRILFDGENPTGHGYDRETNQFSKLVSNIGFIHWAYLEIDPNDPEKYEAIVEVAVWKKYFPEISLRMRQLHSENDLHFSIEAEREFEVTPEGNRRCFNILFNGLCVVDSPAWENSRSLMIAEILKEGGHHNMEEMMKLLESMKGSISAEIAEQFKNSLGVLNETISNLKAEIASKDAENASVKEELATANGALKDAEAERDKFKGIVETAEKEKLGAERLTKLSKYGKVEKTANELAELDKESFVSLLEDMVSNYTPETAEMDNSIGQHFEKTGNDKKDRKAMLLDFVEGFSK